MSTRLPAEKRKAAVLDCACGIFTAGSYRGTTTAEIARKAKARLDVAWSELTDTEKQFVVEGDGEFGGMVREGPTARAGASW